MRPLFLDNLEREKYCRSYISGFKSYRGNSVERISILDSIARPFNKGEMRNEIEAHLDPGNDDRADSIGSSSAGGRHAAARTARPRRRTTATASDNDARRREPAAGCAAAGGKDFRHSSQRKDRRTADQLHRDRRNLQHQG